MSLWTCISDSNAYSNNRAGLAGLIILWWCLVTPPEVWVRDWWFWHDNDNETVYEFVYNIMSRLYESFIWVSSEFIRRPTIAHCAVQYATARHVVTQCQSQSAPQGAQHMTWHVCRTSHPKWAVAPVPTWTSIAEGIALSAEVTSRESSKILKRCDSNRVVG